MKEIEESSGGKKQDHGSSGTTSDPVVQKQRLRRALRDAETFGRLDKEPAYVAAKDRFERLSAGAVFF